MPNNDAAALNHQIKHPSLAEHQQPMNWPPMQAFNHYNQEQQTQH